MIVVIVVVAVVALVLFGLIMAKGRSRFSDESERFRYVSELTSQWSRQKSAQGSGQGSGQAQGSQVVQAPNEPIDLRDAVSAPADRAGTSERR